MSDSETDGEWGLLDQFESEMETFASASELVMEVLELLTALIMIILFAIGVFDLGLKLYSLVSSGAFTDPNEIIKLIDTVLLLLIIVEIYRTVVAYIENLNILPLVLHVALIAMARKIISFRTGEYHAYTDALIAAGAYGFLLLVLVITFYLLHRAQEITEFDIYTEPFSTIEERVETVGAENVEEEEL